MLWFCCLKVPAAGKVFFTAILFFSILDIPNNLFYSFLEKFKNNTRFGTVIRLNQRTALLTKVLAQSGQCRWARLDICRRASIDFFKVPWYQYRAVADTTEEQITFCCHMRMCHRVMYVIGSTVWMPPSVYALKRVTIITKLLFTPASESLINSYTMVFKLSKARNYQHWNG